MSCCNDTNWHNGASNSTMPSIHLAPSVLPPPTSSGLVAYTGGEPTARVPSFNPYRQHCCGRRHSRPANGPAIPKSLHCTAALEASLPVRAAAPCSRRPGWTEQRLPQQHLAFWRGAARARGGGVEVRRVPAPARVQQRVRQAAGPPTPTEECVLCRMSTCALTGGQPRAPPRARDATSNTQCTGHRAAIESPSFSSRLTRGMR